MTINVNNKYQVIQRDTWYYNLLELLRLNMILQYSGFVFNLMAICLRLEIYMLVALHIYKQYINVCIQFT